MQSDRYDLLNITTFMQELKQRQNLVNIVCDLYCSGLTLEAAFQLAELMQAQAGVFALDLSLNGIKVSSWAEVCRLVAISGLCGAVRLEYQCHHCSHSKKTRLPGRTSRTEAPCVGILMWITGPVMLEGLSRKHTLLAAACTHEVHKDISASSEHSGRECCFPPAAGCGHGYCAGAPEDPGGIGGGSPTA